MSTLEKRWKSSYIHCISCLHYMFIRNVGNITVYNSIKDRINGNYI